MPDQIYNWPAELQGFVLRLRRNSDLKDCYCVDLEMKPEEVSDLSLFKATTRNGRVRFRTPDGRTLVGCMNPLFGIGGSRQGEDCAKVRVSFHGVSAE